MKFFNALPANYPKLLQLYFELYQYALDKELLIEHGHLSVDHFNNILNIAYALGKKEWVINFMDEYSKYLQLGEEKEENVKRLFNAYLKFYDKEYRAAFIILDDLKMEDITYGLRSYTLLIMTIIEGRKKIGFRYDFQQHCNNFKAYVGRKYKNGIISLSIKDGYLRFVNIAKKIHGWKYKSWDKEKLYEEIKRYKDIPQGQWLKDQINGL